MGIFVLCAYPLQSVHQLSILFVIFSSAYRNSIQRFHCQWNSAFFVNNNSILNFHGSTSNENNVPKWNSFEYWHCGAQLIFKKSSIQLPNRCMLNDKTKMKLFWVNIFLKKKIHKKRQLIVNPIQLRMKIQTEFADQ